MVTDEQLIESYRHHEQLFAVADEFGISWQTVYARLRKAGFQVTGNKQRYGSAKDKLAVKGEQEFGRLVPSAIDQNQLSYQPKIDFMVGGFSVDVKSARKAKANPRYPGMRWAFYMKKQITIADFIVCFGFNEDGSQIEACFLIPTDIVGAIDTLSISATGRSKWSKYQVDPNSLSDFFSDIA